MPSVNISHPPAPEISPAYETSIKGIVSHLNCDIDAARMAEVEDRALTQSPELFEAWVAAELQKQAQMIPAFAMACEMKDLGANHFVAALTAPIPLNSKVYGMMMESNFDETSGKCSPVGWGFINDSIAPYRELQKIIIDCRKHNTTDSLADLLSPVVANTIQAFMGKRGYDDMAIATQDLHNRREAEFMNEGNLGLADGTINLSDLQDKGLYNCLYNSALAHNLVIFLGGRSALLVTDIEMQGAGGGHGICIQRHSSQILLYDLNVPNSTYGAALSALMPSSVESMLRGEAAIFDVPDGQRTYVRHEIGIYPISTI